MAIVEVVELGKVTGVLVSGVWIDVEVGTLEEKSNGLVWSTGAYKVFAEKERIDAVRTL